jgi:hypothetical protein
VGDARIVVTMDEVLDAFRTSHTEYLDMSFEDAASTAVVLAAAQIMWLKLYGNDELIGAAHEIAEAALQDAFALAPSTDTIQ